VVDACRVQSPPGPRPAEVAEAGRLRQEVERHPAAVLPEPGADGDAGPAEVQLVRVPSGNDAGVATGAPFKVDEQSVLLASHGGPASQ